VIALPGTLEALLFLSPEPLPAAALADAIGIEEDEAVEALRALAASLDESGRGLVLRELNGGWQLSSHPEAEDAARRLLAKPRTPPLTPAQAETLAIVAYLQPVSRPEIARIRGVNAESAAQTLIERGMIEEAGRSQFGAVLYRTTDLFLRLFGLRSVEELPDVTAWDPSPEVAANIRDRLLRAGEARLGVPAAAAPAEGRGSESEEPSSDASSPEADAEGIGGGESEPAGGGEPAPVIPIA
jgi:segregation and condensation protein B